MKKKTIFSIFIIFALSLCFSVYSTTVTTTCGNKVTTVDRSYFDSADEWEDYLKDINEAECGTREIIIEEIVLT